jgi:hypothetical protein
MVVSQSSQTLCLEFVLANLAGIERDGPRSLSDALAAGRFSTPVEASCLRDLEKANDPPARRVSEMLRHGREQYVVWFIDPFFEPRLGPVSIPSVGLKALGDCALYWVGPAATTPDCDLDDAFRVCRSFNPIVALINPDTCNDISAVDFVLSGVFMRAEQLFFQAFDGTDFISWERGLREQA